jgi:hypothetical protein
MRLLLFLFYFLDCSVVVLHMLSYTVKYVAQTNNYLFIVMVMETNMKARIVTVDVT